VVDRIPLISYGRAKEAVPFLQISLKRWPGADYNRLFLYLARALSGDEAAARAELASPSTEQSEQWAGRLIEYETRRLDDDALRKLATVDVTGNLAGQACEASFYIGLRHWIDGNVAAGEALLIRAANECPRTFTEAMIAKAWLAAGPGLAQEATVAPLTKSATR